MKCKTVHKNLIFFLEKELPVSEMSAVQQHLDTCSECALFASEMKKTLGILETEKIVDDNPYFYTRVKVKLENQVSKENVVFGRPVLLRVLQPVAFSILLILGVYGGIKMGDTGSTPKATNIIAEQDMIPYWNVLDAEPIENFLLQ
jgi:hypothetical protein